MKSRHKVLGFLALTGDHHLSGSDGYFGRRADLQKDLQISPEAWGWVVGGFLFSISFGYFVKWFGSYDLALIPVALMLAVATLLWLRIDATEELIPEVELERVPEQAVPAVI